MEEIIFVVVVVTGSELSCFKYTQGYVLAKEFCASIFLEP